MSDYNYKCAFYLFTGIHLFISLTIMHARSANRNVRCRTSLQGFYLESTHQVQTSNRWFTDPVSYWIDHHVVWCCWFHCFVDCLYLFESFCLIVWWFLLFHSITVLVSSPALGLDALIAVWSTFSLITLIDCWLIDILLWLLWLIAIWLTYSLTALVDCLLGDI